MNLFEKITEVLKSRTELVSLKEALGYTSSDSVDTIVAQIQSINAELDAAITPVDTAPVDPAPVGPVEPAPLDPVNPAGQ